MPLKTTAGNHGEAAKGRGATINPEGRFEIYGRESFDDEWFQEPPEGEEKKPKTVITFERGSTKDAEIYLNRYTRLAAPTMDALVLGVRISRANNDKVGADSFMQQLRRRFPESAQLKELEATR